MGERHRIQALEVEVGAKKGTQGSDLEKLIQTSNGGNHLSPTAGPRALRTNRLGKPPHCPVIRSPTVSLSFIHGVCSSFDKDL